MRVQIMKHGAIKFNCNEKDVFSHLEDTGNRITKTNSASHQRCEQILTDLLNDFPALVYLTTDILAAVFRYMKTPSFLVRFAAKSRGQSEEDWIDQSFNSEDESGVTLKETIRSFFKFLNNRTEDRDSFIDALKSIQPGGIKTKDVTEAFANDELPDETENIIMANVRLCYGATNHETRQKLMKTFNTPFFPDILITSSVMSEGVDLQLNCRHIIHHDLCWNPSTLEQRTGRVDRIGAKSEKLGKSINVYIPYLSETQDEKMYKVVMERERWFNIIMGEKYKVDAATTDKYAERIALPDELSRELSFKLEVL
ncbi:MAG: helicase-related protein [Chitinophagaceae bacterium]